MSEKTDSFIKTIGLLARNEYLARDKWIQPSICIAQAALESGWNLSAGTLFGIKGVGFTATTSEFYNGHYEQIEDSFRAYPDAASAVVGYYDFLRDTPRYANALNNPDYKDAVDKLIHTTDGKPYATDPKYIIKIVSIIEDFNLTEYDGREEVAPAPQEEPQQAPAQTASNTYTVQSGDCLSVIAQDFGVDMNKLASLNGIEDVNKIYAGEVLQIPGNTEPTPEQSEPESSTPNTYTVQPGDCLSVIAQNLGVDMNTLASENGIEDVSLIYPGQELNY